MSLAKKEEVCSQRLVLQLDEPAVGVPIKKRPVFSDRSVASALPVSMKAMPVTATGTDRCEEPFFNTATNVITKGKGTPDTQIQDHANTSLTALSMTNGNGVLFNESSEIPSIADSATRTSELQRQNYLALDLQLPSRQSGQNNHYGSLVKEEKLDHSFSEHQNNIPVANEINASGNNIVGRLPNLDLNILPDPADSLEGLPNKVHESGSGLYHHRTIQLQKSQVTPAAAISTLSSGLSRNIGSSLNMSNSYGLSHKSGPADVTLDLQLKPPARPELGINWKGLAPAPELSLSLFGKPVDEPKSLSTPDGLFDYGTGGSSKKVSEEAAATPTLGLDKAPVEKIVAPVPCNVNPLNTTSATVSGIDQLPSNNLVKKEPEEISQQHILDGDEKANLLERQSFGLISCAESEKTDSAPQGPCKTGFDLNSDIFTNNSIHNGSDVAAVSESIPAESLLDTSHTKTVPAVPEVDKCVKHEESTSATPSLPVVETGSGHTTLLMEAKSLPAQSNVANPSVGLGESSSQPAVSTVCKPPASHTHAHEDTRQRSCDANESCGALPSSSNTTVETLPFNSLGNAIVDGMSQGSAEMDCSDDDGNTVSRIPTINKPHGVPVGNGPVSKDGLNTNNLSKELKREHDSDMHQDCSSMTNKVNIDPIDGEKCVKTKVGALSHADQQGLRNEVFVGENSKDKQSFHSDDKNTPVNSTDSSIHAAKKATGSITTNLRKSLALPKSSPKLQPSKQSPKTLDRCLEKTRSPDMKSEMSPNGMQAGTCRENHAKIAALKTEHHTESEGVGKHSDLCPRDSVVGEDSELDGASSSQQHSEYGKKSASEKSEHDKSKPDSCNASLHNEKDGQLVGANWRELGHAYVNRNERWERFMESEREKNNGEFHGGRHASDIMNKRMTNHRGGWRGVGSRGHLRNFRGPRMSNEFADESTGGRRRSFEDEPGHIRGPHRRHHSPLHGCPMREDIDDFYEREIPDSRLLARGQIEDLSDDIMDDRFFMPHSHRHRGQGDHEFIHRDRSHSPAHRRGGLVHFHRGRSPEAMHRSPPLMRTDRPYLPHRRHNGSQDEREVMQRNVRRCAMEANAFEPPLHAAHLAGLHAEEELVGRRKYRERRAYLHSPVSDEDEMLSYHTEDDMEFTEGGVGPREHDGRFRNRLGHSRARAEQEDGYRHRVGHQGWRDSDSNDRPKRRRY